MLTLENTIFVLVDYQERLAQVMHEKEQLHENMKKLIQGAKLLKIPVLWVEQYPKGLGRTKEDIKELLQEDYEPIAKMDFSALRNEQFQQKMKELKHHSCIVAGIEAHVCVYQTVKQLVALGRHVEFVQDCISSRTKENKKIAIQKMIQIGAFPTSLEMLLFELLKTAEHPQFKAISTLIK